MYLLDDGRMINGNGYYVSQSVKPRPLSDNIGFVGYASNSLTYGVFDGRYFWFHGTYPNPSVGTQGTMKKFDSQTATSTTVYIPGITDDKRVLHRVPIYFDGKNIISNDITGNNLVFINPETLETFNIDLPEIPDSNTIKSARFAPCTNDNDYVWGYIGYQNEGTVNTHAIYKIRKEDYHLDFYTFDRSEWDVEGLAALVRTEDALWLIATTEGKMIKLNPTDMSYRIITTEKKVANLHLNAFYNNGYIWIFNNHGKDLRKFNVSTEEFTDITLTGNNLGNFHDVAEPTTFSCFDGRYIWCAPSLGNKYIRFDTITETAQGYDLNGDYDYGNIPTLAATKPKFRSTFFDGKTVWFFPYDGNRIVKIQPNEKDLVITERYQDEAGKQLQANTYQYICEGEDYTQLASTMADYEYLGYKVDGEALQTGSTANIQNVMQDHEVIFIYKKKDDEGGNNGNGNGNCCECYCGFIPIVMCKNKCFDFEKLFKSCSCCNCSEKK